MLIGMELQAVTGQLQIIDGDVQSETAVPGILAQSAPDNALRERRNDFLFVHFSLSGIEEETAVFSQELLHLISRSFYTSGGSVTSALRKAIITANERLLRRNISSSDTHEGAVTCSVLRNNALFTLQVGESITYLGHQFGIEKLPPNPPSRIMPMGRTAGLDFRFFHHELAEGDMLLFLDPRLAHLPSRIFKPALVDSEVESGIETVRHIVGEDSGRLLLVEFTEHAPTDFPLADDSPPPPPPSTDIRDKLTDDSRRAAAKTAMGVAVFTGWLADFLNKLYSSDENDEGTSHWAVPAAIAVIVPILIAVVGMNVYVKRQYREQFSSVKTEMRQHIQIADNAGDDIALAREHYTAALELAAEEKAIYPQDTELNNMQAHLLAALDQLDNVVRLTAQSFYQYDEGTRLTAVALREGYKGGIYTIDSANNAVYYHHTDQTYLNPANPSEETPDQIFFGGQAIGSVVVQNLVDGIWDEDNFIVLDSTGTLLTAFPEDGTVKTTPLGLASEWQQPTDIDTFNGRFYILDSGIGEIWKYFGSNDGRYVVDDAERILTFDSTLDPDMVHMIDFDIYSEDGSLLALYDDGRVRYYDTRSGRILWDEAALMKNGLQTPFVAPAAGKLIGRGLNSSIFIADPGSGRIVQISRAGTVLAQYRAATADGTELFRQINDFTVAESPLRLFVVTDTAVYNALLK